MKWICLCALVLSCGCHKGHTLVGTWTGELDPVTTPDGLVVTTTERYEFKSDGSFNMSSEAVDNNKTPHFRFFEKGTYQLKGDSVALTSTVTLDIYDKGGRLKRERTTPTSTYVERVAFQGDNVTIGASGGIPLTRSR